MHPWPFEEIADVKRTPVGDVMSLEALLSWGSFGGEPSGAWIFPGHSLCPDGPYAAALLCEIASEWDIVKELGLIALNIPFTGSRTDRKTRLTINEGDRKQRTRLMASG